MIPSCRRATDVDFAAAFEKESVALSAMCQGLLETLQPVLGRVKLKRRRAAGGRDKGPDFRDRGGISVSSPWRSG